MEFFNFNLIFALEHSAPFLFLLFLHSIPFDMCICVDYSNSLLAHQLKDMLVKFLETFAE